MNKLNNEIVRALAIVVGAAGLIMTDAGTAWAQQKAASKKDIEGSWVLVSQSTTTSDGKKIQAFGSDPKGLLVFLPSGAYTLQICSAQRPKFASNARDKGTPEENQAAVRGCNPHWGKYAVDAKTQSIVFDIQHAMYPNWEGTRQERKFTVSGDRLTYFVPTASVGGTADLVWRRAK
jgi:hypothetical protein